MSSKSTPCGLAMTGEGSPYEWSMYGLEEWRLERYAQGIEAMEERMRTNQAARQSRFDDYLEKLRQKRDAARGTAVETETDDVD
ncbi:hypothetical protein [Streptomyces sp. NPDC002078]